MYIPRGQFLVQVALHGHQTRQIAENMWCGRVSGSARDVPSKTGYRLDSEIVDDFVAASAPGFNKYLQTSTRLPQAIDP